MNNSQHNSKKRKLGAISNQQQEDEDILFGYTLIYLLIFHTFSDGGNREARDDLRYRNLNDQDEEALEDDDAVLHDEAQNASDEGDGDDLIEDMEK